MNKTIKQFIAVFALTSLVMLALILIVNIKRSSFLLPQQMPLEIDGLDTAVTSFQVQNKTTSLATVNAKYYDASGTLVKIDTFTVAAGSVTSIYQPNVPGLPSGYAGGVVLESNRQIGVAVGEVITRTSGRSGASQYSGLAEAETGNTFYLPTVNKKFGGGQYSSHLLIQNASDSTNSLTVRYFGADGTEITSAQTNHALNGYGSIYLSLDQNPNLTAGYYGSAVVSSTNGQKLAVVVNIVNSEGRLTAYNGFVSGAARSYAPSILRYAGGGRWTTSFQVMAIDPGTTTVTLKYYGTGSSPVKTVTETLTQYRSLNRFQGDGGPDTDLGSSWFGSLVVEATQKIVLIINQANYAGGLGASSYNGFTQGSTVSYLPAVTKNFGSGQYISSFQTMNVGNSLANLSVKYFNPGSTTPRKTLSFNLNANNSLSLYLGDSNHSDIENGWAGSVVVESINGIPIVVVAAQSGASVNGDGATQYNGIR